MARPACQSQHVHAGRRCPPLLPATRTLFACSPRSALPLCSALPLLTRNARASPAPRSAQASKLEKTRFIDRRLVQVVVAGSSPLIGEGGEGQGALQGRGWAANGRRGGEVEAAAFGRRTACPTCLRRPPAAPRCTRLATPCLCPRPNRSSSRHPHAALTRQDCSRAAVPGPLQWCCGGHQPPGGAHPGAAARGQVQVQG